MLDWGTSGKIRNEKIYVSTNPKAIRLVRNWIKANWKKKNFSGLWLLFNNETRDKAHSLFKSIEKQGFSREDEKIDERLFELRHALKSVKFEKVLCALL